MTCLIPLTNQSGLTIEGQWNLQVGRENAFIDANGSPNFVQLGPCTITDAKRPGNMGENGAANESVKS